MNPEDLKEVLAVAAEERRVCRQDEVKPLYDALKQAWDWIGYQASDRPAKVDLQIITALDKAKEVLGIE